MRTGLQLFIAIAGLAAAALLLHWCLVQPPLLDARAINGPVFVELLVGASRHGAPSPEWFRHLNLAIIAAIGLASSALALFILFKSQLSATTSRLAAALALGPLSAGYFFFVETHAAYPTALGAGPSRLLASTAAYVCAFVAAVFLARFFLEYPRRPSVEELSRHYADSWEQLRTRVRTGWRARVYPRGAAILGDADEPRSKWAQRLQRWTKADHVRTWRFFWSPWALAIAVALGAASALVGFYSQGQAGAPARDGVALARSIVWGVDMMGLVAVFIAAFEGLQFHHREAFAEDRARIDWIYATLLVAGWLLVVIPPVWWLVLILLPEEGRSAAWQSPSVALFGPAIVGLEIFVAAFLTSIAVSIFYRGAVDPRLAAQRITLFGLLSLVVAILFLLVERVIVVKVVAWLRLPHETGFLLAAAAVAGTLAPVRSTIEHTVNGWVTRYLPLETMMQGERRTLAVVLSDISGYTALSARDEKQAMLLAALLQRQASQVASEEGGRVVKSMGDAVILAFESPAQAARAIDALHRRFGEATGPLGLESLPLHTGAHYGEVTQTRDGDLYGQTINIAARLQSVAVKGQRVVSAQFAEAARLAPNCIRSLGARHLRNVPEAIECSELLAEPAAN